MLNLILRGLWLIREMETDTAIFYNARRIRLRFPMVILRLKHSDNKSPAAGRPQVIYR